MIHKQTSTTTSTTTSSLSTTAEMRRHGTALPPLPPHTVRRDYTTTANRRRPFSDVSTLHNNLSNVPNVPNEGGYLLFPVDIPTSPDSLTLPAIHRTIVSAIRSTIPTYAYNHRFASARHPPQVFCGGCVMQEVGSDFRRRCTQQSSVNCHGRGYTCSNTECRQRIGKATYFVVHKRRRRLPY